MENSEFIENTTSEESNTAKKRGRPKIAPEDKPLARSLYLPKEVWDSLDAHCKKIHMSRNAYLLNLIMNAIDKQN